MEVKCYVLDVGHGNMVLVILPNGSVILVDCNVTNENESAVFHYLAKVMPRKQIDVFVNTHRDSDHFRGIAEVHKRYPIQCVWDSEIPGTSPGTREYEAYMRLRRSLPCTVIKGGEYFNQNTGGASIRILSSRYQPGRDPNSQSIVLKIQSGDGYGSSVILPGDSDAVTWKWIMRERRGFVQAHILLASHHGSISFFDDPGDSQHYYTKHIQAIRPNMTLISVGHNSFGHPDSKAVELYTKYSAGSSKGNKIKRTDLHGDLELELRSDGSWTVRNRN